mmetsp:Transcript_86925/g.246309  ORF Transcript_86925/g.246309 Transcript_86925/m.246309 type:complete len:386 (-) Transcript_86925:319-1476(-)
MALPIGTTKRAVTTIWRSSLDSRPARLTIIKRATRAWRATPKPSRLLPRRQPLPNHLKSLWLAIWAEPSLSPATSSLRSRATQSPMRTIFLWFLGDIGYADDSFIHSGAYVQFDYEIAYNEFMEQIEPFAAIKPVMVLPGNHEAECHSPNCQLSSTKVHQLSNFSAYVHRFRMPYDESGATSNMWYSFDVPPIHFVNIDTETDYKNAPNDSYTPFTSNGNFANGGSWTEWLEADLDKVDRSHTPFVFVGGHRPIYSVTSCDSNGNPADDSANLQAAIEDIMYSHEVDVYFAGHKHSYERSYPVYKAAKESDSYDAPRAPVHVVTGAGGCDEGHDDDSKAVNASWHVMHDTSRWGYGMIVADETSFTWTQYDAATDTAIDTFTLKH